MKILVACEESQAVTKELRALGHEAFSCDIIPCSGGHPEWHIQGDALKLIYPDVWVCSLEPEIEDEMFGTFKTMDGTIHELPPKWDMILAFPPCTYLTNAGARHLYKGGVLNQERYEKGLEAKVFFLKFWNAPCERIVIENPTPSRVFELPEKTQVIQPWQFGHPYTKRTQLWLKGLPPLQPTEVVEPERTWCPSGSYSKKHGEKHRGMFTKDRARNRSKTFPGIAKAMAEQWAGDAHEMKGESKEMELKMNEYQLPEKISFNYEELKQELMNKVEMYTNLVYTDEQIGDAKKDKANLNRLKEALNNERIRLQKEYMKPFDSFKGQIDEIISIIDKPVGLINKQVKEFEAKQKDEKMAAIEELFGTIGFQDFVRLDMIWNEKWLNKSESMKKIEEAMKSEMCRIGNDIFTLQSLPEFGFEATEIYKKSLDVNKAIAEAQRMSEIAKKTAAQKAEFEAKKKEAAMATGGVVKKQEETVVAGTVTATVNVNGQEVPVAEIPVEAPAKQWISFSALLSTEDALALRDFLNSKGIEFKAI